MAYIGKNSQIYLDIGEYTEGFKPLDEQHRGLIIRINLLQDLLNTVPLDSDRILSEINEFEKAAFYHFGFEAEMMEEIKYNDEARKAHAQHHIAAGKVIDEVKALCLGKSEKDPAKLAAALVGWFKTHERDHDHPMVVEFLKYLKSAQSA